MRTLLLLLPLLAFPLSARASNAVGYLDTSGDTNRTFISGWASDADYAGPVAVHVYIDGVLVKALLADAYRADVGNHAFGWVPPSFGAGEHDVVVYAIGADATGAPDGYNPSLTNSPQTFTATCDGLADPAYAWCRDNSNYYVDRQSDTTLLGNNYVRAGVDTSYGGTIFQLYDDDWQDNLLAEHGGAAVQLSVWGYDETGGATAAAWFRASNGAAGSATRRRTRPRPTVRPAATPARSTPTPPGHTSPTVPGCRAA